VVPIAFVFGNSALSRALTGINRLLVRLNPKLFGFQILVVARPRPTLKNLLEDAKMSAEKKSPLAMARVQGRLHRTA
jgi:hypothetical protein